MTMVILDTIDAPRRLWRRLGGWLHKRMPKGLYARALLILILPIVLLQSAVAYVYMQRHWEAITDRLSAGVARDTAAIVELYRSFPEDADHQILTRVAGVDLAMKLSIKPRGPLPPSTPKGFFSLLDHVLPRSRGGQSTWENLVACCHECNRRKGNALPHECGMRPIKEPRPFSLHTSRHLMRMMGRSDAKWRKYLYY